MFFSRHARQVTLLVRGDSLERSMSHYLIQQLAALGNVTVRTCTEVAAAHGDQHLEGLTLRDATNMIDNAADAMHGEGTLTVRTARDGEFGG